MELSHEQTLQWINDHKAWRLAKKTMPIRARPVEPSEVGQRFQTADRIEQAAKAGYWLCVGVAGEPWFQDASKIESKYEEVGQEVKQLAFGNHSDDQPRLYHIYQPRGQIQNWAARVEGEGITGFQIRPNYESTHPLFSPAGGYVVKDHVPDPYQGDPNDVWLVQEALFKSTYELVE